MSSQVKITTSRNGLPTAEAGSRRIHSAYNPLQECKRFIESLDINVSNGSVIVVIGAGLGYADLLLSQLYPQSRVISMHLNHALFKSRVEPGKIIAGEGMPENISCWHPESGISAEDFFYSVIQEEDISGLTVVEWPPSAASYTKQAGEVSEALASVLRRYSGNITTTAAFGQKWIKNTLRNFTEIDKMVSPVHISAQDAIQKAPVVIAASGPSLEDFIPVLKKIRKKVRLWALPSSMTALNNAGIIPEMVFATDPGYWARMHTRYFPEEVPVAMPFSAAPLPSAGYTVLPILQEGPGESMLVNSVNRPCLPLPERGTVAATAVEAWKKTAGGPLILAGLDLAWQDIRSHVRPHTFETWNYRNESRLKPRLTSTWESAFQAGKALNTYADWFRQNLPEGRVYRFKPACPLPSAKTADETLLSKLTENLPDLPPLLTSQKTPERADARRKSVQKLLRHWKTLHIEYSRQKSVNSEAKKMAYCIDTGGVLEIKKLKGKEKSEAWERHNERISKAIKDWERQYG